MEEQHGRKQRGQEERSGSGNEQGQQPNAFGQPQQDRYQARDERPYQTGNVSWESSQSHRGKGPKGYKRSDDRIKDDVYHRLTEDDLIDASEVEVQVTNAEVILSGVVPEREAKRRAEDIIDSISGVQHVQNNLRVKNQTPSSQKGREQDRETDRNSAGTAGTGNIEVM